jgi:REP element-mobilizing transposase RayT
MPERKYQYRRNLPHLQRRGKLLFVTFCTFRRLELPPRARDIVLASCLRENEVRAYLLCAVVMPDHVHLLFKPMIDKEGNHFRWPKLSARSKARARMKSTRFSGAAEEFGR